MPPTLVAHEKAVQKIFSDDYVFSIPDYQRPYSWTTEQARDLLDDLTSFMEANPGPIPEMPSYFLGSIVLIKGLAAPNAAVVDGQQRLTTLTLLLSAIRANVDEARRSSLTRRIYETGDELTNTPDQFRLSLREKDRAFFRDFVQREKGFPELIKLQRELTDSQRRIQENAQFFDARLRELTEGRRLELASFILQRCFLVVVETSDEESAFRIFSVLNSRGLDLTATDILKAKVIGAIRAEDRQRYTDKWETAEEELGRDDFNTLFGHIRTVYSKTKAQGTLLKEFEQFVPELKSPARFMDDLLLPMAEAYEILTAADYASIRNAEKVNERLRWLNRLEFKDWLPPALAFVIRHKGDPDKMLAFVSLMERLSFFMLVTRKGIYDRIERFARVTRC